MVTLLTERLPHRRGFSTDPYIRGKIEEVGPHLTRYRIDGLIRIRKALIKVCSDPLCSSLKTSLSGYRSEPASTECSRI